MLTDTNYYQDTEYFSYSLYKKFMDCEAAAYAELIGEYRQPVTDAMLVGSYVDAVVEGTLEQFVSEHTEVISSKGPTKGQLKSSFKQADVMIERFQRDSVFMEYLQGEKQVILTGKIAEVPVKSKLDILHDNRIIDFKTVKDFETIWCSGERLNFIEYWKYDVQGAIYRELVRQKTGKKLPYYIAAVTKEPFPDLAIIHLSDKSLDIKLKEVEYFLPQFQAIKIGLAESERCEKCDYCKQTKVLTGPIEIEQL